MISTSLRLPFRSAKIGIRLDILCSIHQHTISGRKGVSRTSHCTVWLYVAYFVPAGGCAGGRLGVWWRRRASGDDNDLQTLIGPPSTTCNYKPMEIVRLKPAPPQDYLLHRERARDRDDHRTTRSCTFPFPSQKRASITHTESPQDPSSVLRCGHAEHVILSVEQSCTRPCQAKNERANVIVLR